MLESLLDKTKAYTQITKELSSETIIFEKLLERFSADTGSSIVFLDNLGNFIFEKLESNHFSLNNGLNTNCKIIDVQLNEQLKNIVEIKNSLTGSTLFVKTVQPDTISDFKFTVVPVSALTQRIGTIISYKNGEALSEEDLAVLDFVSALTAVLYFHIKTDESADNDRKINLVKSAIGTLSYSELEAIIHIFNELDGDEGLLVASKIADKVGITRSVIVNALRKFESAGVIESRSLGMKGTYIKVMNEFLIKELNKLKK